MLLVPLAFAAPPYLGTYRPTASAAAGTLDDLEHPDGPVLAGGLWWDDAEGAWEDRNASYAARRGTGSLAISADFGHGLRIEGLLPVVLVRLGDEFGHDPAPQPTALGNAGLRVRWTGHAGPWRLGVAGRLDSGASEFTGGLPSGGPEVALASVHSWGRVQGQAAWMSGRWDARVGLELRPAPDAACFGELQVAGPDSGPMGAEVRGGVRGDLTPVVRAEAGLGVGLIRPPGTPEYRVFGGVVVHSPVMRHRHPEPRPVEPAAVVAPEAPVELDYDAGVLSDATLALLDATAAHLRADPARRVRIEAYVRETRASALRVAWMRAALVRRLLVERGVSPDQVEVAGASGPGADRMWLIPI